MKVDAKTKSQYFILAGERGAELRKLDDVIQKSMPDVPPAPNGGIFYSMISYGLMPYKPKSAKAWGEWPLIMLAVQKNYLALYVCAIDPDGKYIAEKYASKLGNVSCGKSCIRFKKFDDLNLDTLREILSSLNDRYKAGEKLYG